MSEVWAATGAIAAAIGIIGVLARISYQLGGLVAEFRAYAKTNDAIIGKIDYRVAALERRRR